ncbi:MAG: adenine-specific methyltransferase EcoRI family protein [Treponema sp.]|nr:adenine-specific methyltransferase EcoRI family protein [Treponema sp.]
MQASLEPSECKIGKTHDYDRRLKEYNNMTGKSKENIYQYLFASEVKDMTEVENDINEKYSALSEEKSREIYFYNAELFRHYIESIRTHEMFVKEIFIRAEEKKQIKIIKRTTPAPEEHGLTKKDLMQKAQKVKNDEFYTRLDDIEKELSMYDRTAWKDKTLFHNCDDAVDDDCKNTSAFALCFLQNFKGLELKKIICTHYSGPVDLFNQAQKGMCLLKTVSENSGNSPKTTRAALTIPCR